MTTAATSSISAALNTPPDQFRMRVKAKFRSTEEPSTGERFLAVIGVAGRVGRDGEVATMTPRRSPRKLRDPGRTQADGANWSPPEGPGHRRFKTKPLVSKGHDTLKRNVQDRRRTSL
jgi:hypothetical protein